MVMRGLSIGPRITAPMFMLGKLLACNKNNAIIIGIAPWSTYFLKRRHLLCCYAHDGLRDSEPCWPASTIDNLCKGRF